MFMNYSAYKKNLNKFLRMNRTSLRKLRPTEIKTTIKKNKSEAEAKAKEKIENLEAMIKVSKPNRLDNVE